MTSTEATVSDVHRVKRIGDSVAIYSQDTPHQWLVLHRTRALDVAHQIMRAFGEDRVSERRPVTIRNSKYSAEEYEQATQEEDSTAEAEG